MRDHPTRRTVLRAAALGGLGIAAAGACSTNTSSQPARSPSPVPIPGGDRRVLLAYFSRAGENYYEGGRRDLEVGNTEVVADKIRARLGCEVYRIEAADRYPHSYDDTVSRNREEQSADARPVIANPLPDTSGFDTVILGCPIWNVRTPMIMSSMIENIDLANKTILPFVTYAVSGLAGVDDAYQQALPTAQVQPGLAIRGEDAHEADTDVDEWLRSNRLL